MRYNVTVSVVGYYSAASENDTKSAPTREQFDYFARSNLCEVNTGNATAAHMVKDTAIHMRLYLAVYVYIFFRFPEQLYICFHRADGARFPSFTAECALFATEQLQDNTRAYECTIATCLSSR